MKQQSKRAVGAAAAAALAAAIAVPALTSANASTGARELTVREKVTQFAFVHHGKAKGDKLATGDVVVTQQALTSPQGTKLGSLHTTCTNTGRKAEVFDAKLQCLSTYRLHDGQVVSAGVVTLSHPQGIVFPIVGGSGAYRGASGEVTPGSPVKGFDGVDVLHLDA